MHGTSQVSAAKSSFSVGQRKHDEKRGCLSRVQKDVRVSLPLLSREVRVAKKAFIAKKTVEKIAMREKENRLRRTEVRQGTRERKEREREKRERERERE